MLISSTVCGHTRWSSLRLGMGAKYCDEYVYVCLSARITQTSAIFVHVAYGLGSVLLCYVLPVLRIYTSCFHIMTRFISAFLTVFLSRDITRQAEISTKFCSTIKPRSTHCELRTGSEVCNLQLPC